MLTKSLSFLAHQIVQLRRVSHVAAFSLFAAIYGCGGGGDSNVNTAPGPAASPKSVTVSLSSGAYISQLAGTTQSYPIEASLLDRSDILEVSLIGSPSWLTVNGSKGRWQLSAAIPASIGTGKYTAQLTARELGGSAVGGLSFQIEVVGGVVALGGILSAESGGFQSDANGNLSIGVIPRKLSSDLRIEMLKGSNSLGKTLYGFRVNRRVTLQELAEIKVSLGRARAPISTAQTTHSEVASKAVSEKAIYAGATRLIPENYALRAGAGGGRLPIKQDMSLADIANACGLRADLLGVANLANVFTNISIGSDLIFGGCIEEFVASESWTIKNTKSLEGTLKPAILFIHGFSARAPFTDGLGGTDGTWGDFPVIASDIGGGYSTHEFRWYTDSRFEDAASDLVQVIDKLRSLTGKPVVIVAHSFGGLLTRTLLQGLAGVTRSNWDRSVRSVLTLGTPHSGILDKAATVAGTALPRGQDSFAIQQLFFNLCKSIACQQAGETVTFTAAATTIRLDHRLFEISEEPGELVARLANLEVNPLPANVPFTVGIGLTTDRNGAGVLDEGDALISYAGQRFHPSFTTSGQVKSLANCNQTNAGTVKEQLIATPLDRKPGQLPYDNWQVFQSLGLVNYKAYKHSSNPPSLDLGDMAVTFGIGTVATPVTALGPVTGTFALIAQEVWRNRGLLSEANVKCAAADSCDHGSFNLLKKILTDANFACPRIEPTVAPQKISLSVPVINATSKAAIAGAAVTLYARSSGSEIATSVTDARGNAKFDLIFAPNAAYDLEAQASGFDRKLGQGHQLSNTAVGSASSVTPIQLNRAAGSRFGELGVKVIDALTGDGINSSNVTITRAGVPFAGPYVLNDGTVKTHSLPQGLYNVDVSARGFIAETTNCESIPLTSTLCNVSLRPVLDASTALIRLTWDQNPYDLDSHLWRYAQNGAELDHIYFRARDANFSGDNLDLDDTSSFGPETTSIQSVDSASRYVFAVNRYNGLGSIATTSLAQVKVQLGSRQIIFAAPTTGFGDWWKVFEIVNGEVIPCSSGCLSDTQPN
jgi:pimeloyl-ACP methyl ester carboxylesterase